MIRSNALSRLVSLIAIAASAAAVFTSLALAQTASPWSAAANLSKSGAASQPVIAVAPDGTLHALWWDATEGMQYARTTSITDTAWTAPVTAAGIFGVRQEDAATNRVTLIAPRDIRLLSSSENRVHALWLNGDNQLLGAAVQGADFGPGTPLAEVAAAFDVSADVSGTLHLAYVRPTASDTAPAGIYYRRNTGQDWGGANAVYTSPYFRALDANRAYVSAAGRSAVVVVAWDDPQSGQSAFARSTDGGVTWTAPQVITGTTGGRTQRARVASTATGGFLLIWQDAGAGGCGYVQRTSNDGGETWSAPERVLGTLARCNAKWTFTTDGAGRLWLIERSAIADAAGTSSVSAAVWLDDHWSEPFELALSFFDATNNRQISLSCLNAAVGGETLGLIGCDPTGDVYGARNAAPLDQFINAPRPAWNPIVILSDQQNPAVVDDLPALAADADGNLYALWNQQIDQANVLFGAAQLGGRWSPAGALLRNASQSINSNIARQPALAISADGKAHAVWNSGTDGAIYYSWTYARDFTLTSGWAPAVALPLSATTSSRPDLAVDPRGGDLFVAYAAPYNEHRGVYLTRSTDGGATWPAAPQQVIDAAAQGWESVDKPRLAFDATANSLHVVWLRSALPGSTSPRAIYYARSADRGASWSAPLKIAEGNVDWPRVAVTGPNEIYLAWTQQPAQTRTNPGTPWGVWGQSSSDGGASWGAPAAVPGFEQISGAFGLVGGEANRLDMAAVAQLPDGESTLLHAAREGQQWGERDVTPLGQSATAGNAAVIAGAPAAGRLGALLRVWMWQADGRAQFEVAATWRDIPKQAVTPPPTFTPAPTATPSPTDTPEPSPTPRPQITGSGQQPIGETRGPSPLIISGVLAAVIVIAGAVGAFYMRRR